MSGGAAVQPEQKTTEQVVTVIARKAADSYTVSFRGQTATGVTLAQLRAVFPDLPYIPIGHETTARLRA